MTSRERFQAVMHFGRPDRLPFLEMKYYPETIQRWHREGLPPDIHPGEYFGDDRRETVPVSCSMVPDPNSESRIIGQDQERIFREDGIGLRTMEYTNAPPPHMPRFIKYPVENREDFERIRYRFDPHAPARVPENWPRLVRQYAGRDFILEVRLGGLFWFLRNLMGPERCLLAFYDDPELVREMISCFASMALWIAEFVTRDVSVDYALFLEDMSYKNGPMFSPDFFRSFFSPHYRAIAEVLQARGVDLIFVDTDGNVDRLVPLFLEVGINGCLPMEVAAGNDPIGISDAFHRRMRMMGGIDKRAIAAGKHTVEAQFNALVPEMAKRGGFIPHVDHAVASDLPFQHYCHYRRLLAETRLV